MPKILLHKLRNVYRRWKNLSRGDGQREMRISTSSKDRCFLLNDGFVFVKEIRANNTYLCDVLTQTDSLFAKPCDSKLLNIAFTSKANLFNKSKRKLLEKKDLKHKVVCLETGEGYALFPMLHPTEV